MRRLILLLVVALLLLTGCARNLRSEQERCEQGGGFWSQIQPAYKGDLWIYRSGQYIPVIHDDDNTWFYVCVK